MRAANACLFNAGLPGNRTPLDQGPGPPALNAKPYLSKAYPQTLNLTHTQPYTNTEPFPVERRPQRAHLRPGLLAGGARSAGVRERRRVRQGVAALGVRRAGAAVSPGGHVPRPHGLRAARELVARRLPDGLWCAAPTSMGGPVCSI